MRRDEARQAFFEKREKKLLSSSTDCQFWDGGGEPKQTKGLCAARSFVVFNFTMLLQL